MGKLAGTIFAKLVRSKPNKSLTAGVSLKRRWRCFRHLCRYLAYNNLQSCGQRVAHCWIIGRQINLCIETFTTSFAFLEKTTKTHLFSAGFPLSMAAGPGSPCIWATTRPLSPRTAAHRMEAKRGGGNRLRGISSKTRSAGSARPARRRRRRLEKRLVQRRPTRDRWAFRTEDWRPSATSRDVPTTCWGLGPPPAFRARTRPRRWRAHPPHIWSRREYNRCPALWQITPPCAGSQ